MQRINALWTTFVPATIWMQHEWVALGYQAAACGRSTSADWILSEVYAKANASDRYRCQFYTGPHKFDLQMQTDAFKWFDQWLKA